MQQLEEGVLAIRTGFAINDGPSLIPRDMSVHGRFKGGYEMNAPVRETDFPLDSIKSCWR